MRYSNATKEKTNGVVYTPTEMAVYLADQMIHYSPIDIKKTNSVSLLDPAVGGGELLIALIRVLRLINPTIRIIATGYETDSEVARKTLSLISSLFCNIDLSIYPVDFLIEAKSRKAKYDFIIANPPYIRTQILGSEKAQEIAKDMNLTGRVDIYYAFLLYMKNLLNEHGVAGYITSNKFFTIKSGCSVRDFMIENYSIHKIVDFGDTKLFAASVLPCIIVFSSGLTKDASSVIFSSIYESKEPLRKAEPCQSIFDHINDSGTYALPDGRKYIYRQGSLASVRKGDLWVIASDERKDWLKKIESNTWIHFEDIGKVRVGIKTTADNVFIGNKWTGENEDIELLRPLITHRDSGQIVSRKPYGWRVLYTHTMKNGKKEAVNLDDYPKSKRYLEQHFNQLANRSYIQKAHRNWYEIWVPQNPASWSKRKIVFRDISEKPEFWLDESGAIVNGDCYWIEIDDGVSEETVYLALAVANSSFIERYYDAKFNTKLYSGKRRFMSQYVEQFPIPYVNSNNAQKAIGIVKKIIAGCNDSDTSHYMEELNSIIKSLFED